MGMRNTGFKLCTYLRFVFQNTCLRFAVPANFAHVGITVYKSWAYRRFVRAYLPLFLCTNKFDSMQRVRIGGGLKGAVGVT